MNDPSTSPIDSQARSGGFWSGETILANKLVVTDFDERQLDANAYNLRMGGVLFKTNQTIGELPGKKILAPREPFIIPPGQFAFLLTREEVCVPKDAMAFISMRTRLKYQGLINVSGFHVDPGYTGKLIYAVYNASPSPVQICEGDSAFKIWFCNLDFPSEKVFQGRGVYDIDNDLARGMSREIHSLQAISDKIEALEVALNLKLAEQKPVIDGLKQAWDNITWAVVVSLTVAIMTVALPMAWDIGRAAFPLASKLVDRVLPASPPMAPATPPPSDLPSAKPDNER